MAWVFSVDIYNEKGFFSLPDRLPTEGELVGKLSSKAQMTTLTNDKELLFCDGKICQIFQNSKWIVHSELIEERFFGPAMVTLANGIYVFGGNQNSKNCHLTSEFLPNGSKVWVKGPNIPEPGFQEGSAVVISDTEVVLTGGLDCGGKRVMKYSTMSY